MPGALLDAVVSVLTVVAVSILVIAWRFLRTGSRRARRILLCVLLSMSLGVLAYGVARHILLERERAARHENRVRAAEKFIERNRAGLEGIGPSLDRLSDLVSGPAWPPASRLEASVEGGLGLLIWGDELRGGPARRFGDLSAARFLSALLEPGAASGYTGSDPSLERVASDFDRASRPLWMLLEPVQLIRPEITSVEFGPSTVRSSFKPGFLSFVVAVVDRRTGVVIAHGPGKAVSSDRVAMTVEPEVLMSDLGRNAERAAYGLACQLLGRESR